MASVTIRDVAKYAGVGVGTVSRVLNGSEAVSEATRHKVLTAIAALDFAPNQTARRLSLGKSYTVAVIVPFLTYPSYVDRIRGVESVFVETDYDFLIYNAESPERRQRYLAEVARGERFDGSILMTLAPDEKTITRFRTRHLPCVVVEGVQPELNRVVIDNVYGGYLATKHLIDLGHTRIGYVTDYLESRFPSQPIYDRFIGYCQALEEADLPYRADYVVQGRHGRDEGRDLAHQLLAMADPPSAIFAYSDTQAFGILEAARQRGLQVPEDLSVIGFDDIEISQYLNLTTVSQSLFASGVVAARMLLHLMNDGGAATICEELPAELIVRGTTGPPAG
ncbi:MAG: LacI family DNA-binding transcriptional regulator [Anaerolineales bacterium]|nr:LacI family DNA-binding transcriptional regulator [Anaerolineales bacterium]MCB0027249.1 LacI family DNA-binding transcriptional regulator [Anaerolineales bacterium]